MLAVKIAARWFTAGVAGSLAGLALAAAICWIWLSTIDGRNLDW